MSSVVVISLLGEIEVMKTEFDFDRLIKKTEAKLTIQSVVCAFIFLSQYDLRLEFSVFHSLFFLRSRRKKKVFLNICRTIFV